MVFVACTLSVNSNCEIHVFKRVFATQTFYGILISSRSEIILPSVKIKTLKSVFADCHKVFF